MQVDPTAALAPVLSRFSVALDGPLDATIVSRLAAAGDGRVLFGDLVRPVPGGPQLNLPDTVAQVRATLSRLLAAGAAEPIAGGYRLTDVRLAHAVQRAVAEAAPPFRPSGPVAPTAMGAGPAGTVPVAANPAGPVTGWSAAAIGPEVARVLQSQVVGTALPPTVVPAPPPLAPLPASWQHLVPVGWTIDRAGHPPGAVSLQGPVDDMTAPLVRLLVADPSSPPGVAAPGLGARWPVVLTHLPTPPIQWGAIDLGLLQDTATNLGALLGGSRDAVVVLDRPLTAALLLLRDALPGPAILDLRAPFSPASVDTTLSTAVAGAGAVAAPRQRTRIARLGRSGRAGLFDLLFGPVWAAADDDAGDDAGDAADDGIDGEATDAYASSPVGGSPPAGPAMRGGAVITSRSTDRHADALGELLGLEVMVLGPDDDLAEEVLAWIEDDTGRTMVAPRT
jgi:hypothetical protein